MKKFFTITFALAYWSTSSTLADVVYKDIPDYTVSQTESGVSPLLIDMNGDGVNDFILATSKGIQEEEIGSFDGESVIITPDPGAPGNKVLGVGGPYLYGQALNAGDNIENTSQIWQEYGGVLAANGILTVSAVTLPVMGGNFYNTTDKYIGVQFMIGTKIHYGWIRVDVTAYNSFTIKDYAYEDTPETPIQAGQTITGLKNYITIATEIKNIDNIIYIEFEKTFLGNIEVINMSGQIIRTFPINGKQHSFGMTTASPGLYNIVVSGIEGAAMKKIAVR